MHLSTSALAALAAFTIPGWSQAPRLWDLVPFGQLSASAGGKQIRSLSADTAVQSVTVTWQEERDIREVRARFGGALPKGTAIEYWFRTWPYPPPTMPTIEDPADDPWQGKWLKARTVEGCARGECTWTFAPLNAAENENARNLPGVNYRRALKLRLTFAAPEKVASVAAYSGTAQRKESLVISLGHGLPQAQTWKGRLSVDNGGIDAVRGWRLGAGDTVKSAAEWEFRTSGQPKGLLVDLTTAAPALAGSNDITVLTLRFQPAAGGPAPRGFSFRTDDLAKGPLFIPDLHACVARPEAAGRCGASRGSRIRALIPNEPEQTYQRAHAEIPPLDPWQDQGGGRVYMPVAIDSNWQKFAVQYGGNVFISKSAAKLKAPELGRVSWEGDRMEWRIGTGAKPYYRDDRASRASVLDGYLPVVIEEWKSDGLDVRQEAFATTLRGPLSPRDAERDEQTPSILMMRLTFSNPSGKAAPAHLWLGTSDKELRVEGQRVFAAADKRGRLTRAPLRAIIQTAGGVPELVLPGDARAVIEVPAGGTASAVLKIPFVSDMTAADMQAAEALDYDRERERIVTYWRQVVEDTVRFAVPEPNFTLLVRSLIPHIRISATKCPRSGLYIAPAASYSYDFFANEACFQAILLDVLGDHETARLFLETLLELQGSRNFEGTHSDPKHAVLKGGRVDPVYDYTHGEYGLDHGTGLWAAALHYNLTGDRAWFERYWPRLRKAIEWVDEQRAATMRSNSSGEKVFEYGLLPAGHLEDNSDWAFWFASNAYAWAGMDRLAAILESLGHADAAAFRHRANAYGADVRAAIEGAIERAPVTRMRDGTYEPWTPVQPYQRFRYFGPLRMAYYTRYPGGSANTMPRLAATREVLYGPLIFLNLGLFGEHEPIADWILDDWEDNLTLSSGLGLNVHGNTDDKLWFSQGGLVFQANLQNPIESYLRRDEAPAAIRTLFNAFTTNFYPGVNMFTEEFHLWGHGSGPFYKIPDEARFVNRLRDALAQERGGELWLASGTPRRWLEQAEGIRVDRLSTAFGDVSYTLRPAAEPGWLEARVQLPTRSAPQAAWLVVRVPGGRIKEATVDGQKWQNIDHARTAIWLPVGAAPLTVRIRYR